MRTHRCLSRLSLVNAFSLVVAAGALASACDKKPAPAIDAAATASAESALSASAAAPSSSASSSSAGGAPADAGVKRDTSSCPTAVAGAAVAIKDVDGGVEVSVTAKDEAATKDIRERMKKLADASKGDGQGGQRHDHSGSGGGRSGRCTIIARGTTLTTSEIPNGAKATVIAKDKSELDWLRRETKKRDDEAKAASAKP